MKIFSFLKHLSLSLLLIVTNTVYTGGPGGMPTMSDAELRSLSPADQQAYQQEMMRQFESMSPADQEVYMQQAVETMFESLSPEEQKQVLDEVAKVEAMSPEEQQAYVDKLQKDMEKEMEQALAQQEAQKQAQKPKPTEPEPTPEPKKPKKEEVVQIKVTAEEKAIKEALQTINELIGNIESFMKKIEAKEDFVYKVGQWGKKKKIKSWSNGYDWQLLKGKIELLVSHLEKLKNRETKTKKYKYLPFLIKEEETYTKLYNLDVDFVNYESSVRVRGKKPLTKKERKKSNKAIRELLDVLSELLVSSEIKKKKKDKKKEAGTDLLSELEKIFAQYEPEAKKIAKEEEKQAARALRESKKKFPASRVQLAGAPQQDYEPYFDLHEDYDDYDRYRGPDEQFEPVEYGKTSEDTKKETKDSKEPGKKPSEKKDVEDLAASDKALKADRKVNRLVTNVDDSLDAIADTIDIDENLQDLGAYFKKKKLDKKLATSQIPTMKNQLSRATRKLEAIKKGIDKFSTAVQDAYKREVKASVDERKDMLEGLLKGIATVGTGSGLPQDMQWAHFGIGPDPDKMLKEAQETEAEPAVKQALIKKAQEYKRLTEEPVTTIPELRDSITKLLKKAKEITSK